MKEDEVNEDSMSWKGDLYAIGYICFWIVVVYGLGKITIPFHW